MSDIELNDLGKPGDGFGCGKIEAVPGMNFESRSFGERGAANNTLEFRLRGGRLSGRDGIAPGAGMDLDHRCADFHRSLDLRRLGGDKQRYPDPGIG